MSPMKNHLCSFLSRLALCGLAAPLILLSPGVLRADTTRTFVVPSVQADPLFRYSYSSPGNESFTTAPIPVVTMATTVPAAELTATSTSGIAAGCTITFVVLDSGGNGSTFSNLSGCGIPVLDIFDNFPLIDYSTPGTHISANDTLVVTVAPEPSSGVLMLLGLGLMFVTRKRIGHSRPSAV